MGDAYLSMMIKYWLLFDDDDDVKNLTKKNSTFRSSLTLEDRSSKLGLTLIQTLQATAAQIERPVMFTLFNPLNKPTPRFQRHPQNTHHMRNRFPTPGKPGSLSYNWNRNPNIPVSVETRLLGLLHLTSSLSLSLSNPSSVCPPTDYWFSFGCHLKGFDTWV